jgi:DNA-directed RNA polymerase specialized sigma24 family protein
MRRAAFVTTHWSVVLASADPDSPQARAALEQLCRTYWYPLYCYIRLRGYSHEDAEDLTQGFLLWWLEHKSFARADASKGWFRSFLLASLNHFLSDQWDRASAQKRGGGRPTLSLMDTQGADERYRLEPVDERSPEKLFDRRWALTLLDRVLARSEPPNQAHSSPPCEGWASALGAFTSQVLRNACPERQQAQSEKLTRRHRVSHVILLQH